MSDQTFYAKGKNRGHHRKLVVNNVIMLTPSANKRVKLPCTMSLSKQKQSGTPEWIAAAHEFVAKSHDAVMPDVKFTGFDINFATENLFQQEGISSPKCEMKSFSIMERGGEDDSEVVMKFAIIAPFSTALWDWVGQMAGDEIWAKFEQGAAEEEDQGDLRLTEDGSDPPGVSDEEDVDVTDEE